MKIAIVGCRGIPNTYGGFEQFAEHLSTGLVLRGHEVVVFNPHDHPYTEESYRGVGISRAYDPGRHIGSASQILYDFLSLRDALKQNNEIILELGYQSSALSLLICNTSDAIVVTNMDGMEWTRAKWSRPVKVLTRWFEALAVRQSDYLISDSVGIQGYIMEKHGVDSTYIPYGAEPFDEPDLSVPESYGLEPGSYFIQIARLEPENNMEMVIEGIISAGEGQPYVLVGNYETSYGQNLKNRYSKHENIRFMGGIYDMEALNSLRYFSKLYFHGHSVGGTNPSLLEAMASSAFIASFDNIHNRSVLGDDAMFFNSSADVTAIIRDMDLHTSTRDQRIENNSDKIRNTYSWDNIIDQYEDLFRRAVSERNADNPG